MGNDKMIHCSSGCQWNRRPHAYTSTRLDSRKPAEWLSAIQEAPSAHTDGRSPLRPSFGPTRRSPSHRQQDWLSVEVSGSGNLQPAAAWNIGGLFSLEERAGAQGSQAASQFARS